MFEEQRGGVVAAIATVGVIVSTDVPQLFGAMFIGPLAGYTFAKIEQILLPKVKEGYEMLTKTFSRNCGRTAVLFWYSGCSSGC